MKKPMESKALKEMKGLICGKGEKKGGAPLTDEMYKKTKSNSVAKSY